jgi:hypothetical protein
MLRWACNLFAALGFFKLCVWEVGGWGAMGFYGKSDRVPRLCTSFLTSLHCILEDEGFQGGCWAGERIHRLQVAHIHTSSQ